WNAAGRNGLSYVFVASASVAAGGVGMDLAPIGETGPARLLALTGTAGEMVAMGRMKKGMHPAEVDPLEAAEPGRKLDRAEKMLIAGAPGKRSWKTRAVLRGLSVVSGAALAAASAYTRFGVLEAGIESTKDPRHVVEPQRARLEERRAAGIVDDSITTGR